MAKPCIDNFKPSFLSLILAKVYVTLVVALPIAVTSAQEKKTTPEQELIQELSSALQNLSIDNCIDYLTLIDKGLRDLPADTTLYFLSKVDPLGIDRPDAFFVDYLRMRVFDRIFKDDSTLYYADRLIDNMEEVQPFHAAKAIATKQNVLVYASRFKTVIDLYYQHNEFLERHCSECLLYSISQVLFSYLNIGQYDSLIILGQIGEEKAMAAKDTARLIDFATRIAAGYKNNKKFELANDYLIKASNLVVQNDAFQGIWPVRIAYSRSLLFRDQLQLDSAIKYMGKSIRRLQRINPNQAAYYLPALATLYADNRQYEEAKAILDTIPRQTFTSDNVVYSEYLYAKGVMSSGIGDFKTAVSSLDSAIDLRTIDKRPREVARTYYALSEVYGKMRSGLKSLEAYKKADAIEDSLFSLEKEEIVADLESKYNLSQKEAEIFRLETVAERERVTNNLFGTGMVVLLLISGVIYRFYYVKKRDNKKIQKQSDELEVSNHQLLELSNYKQGLTDMIAHDMKNSLNVVLGMSASSEDEKIKEINQSGKLMLQMVTNMLDVQKFEETKMKLSLQSVSLTDLVAQAKLQIELLLVSKSILFRNEIPDNLFVKADPDLLTRVLVNLFTNAIKYSPAGESIVVRSEAHGEEKISVSVVDAGRGIEEDQLPHVFEKFWQVEARKSGAIQSTGLGLTFCKMAIEAHGGEISVESELGKGSTFSFVLEISHLEEPSESKADSLEGLTLTRSNLEMIRPLVERIRALPMYRVSKIKEELDQIPNTDKELEEWRKKVLNAVLSWDEKAYSELLDL